MSSKNILIAFYASFDGVGKYQDFANCFIESGNNVLLCNIDPSKDCKRIKKNIFDFNPDLAFSFNNIVELNIIESLRCPIAIIDADNPQMFWNKENINYPNLYYFGYQSNSDELYRKILNVEINSKNYMFLSFTATSVKFDLNMKQDKNISFIGTNFYYHSQLRSTNISQEELLQQISDNKNYYDYKRNISDLMTSQDRLEYLGVLTDLGLNIYGDDTWLDVSKYSYKIAKCFDATPMKTQEDNQRVYNQSKISININHAQATKSFSWRVPDIMASNSCLVTSYSEDWENLFGKYISDEVKSAIIYEDRYDLRKKCIKLLEDERLRMRCVKECQNAIEENGRWHHRIKKIESFLKIDLLNESDIKGKIDLITNKKFSKKVAVKNKSSRNYRKIYYSLVIFLHNIPVVGNLISKRKYDKFLTKLN